jgi:hypothetical protein
MAHEFGRGRASDIPPRHNSLQQDYDRDDAEDDIPHNESLNSNE